MPVTLLAGILSSQGVKWDEFRIVRDQVHLLWKDMLYIFRYYNEYSMEAREYYHAVAEFIRSHQLGVICGDVPRVGVTVYVDEHLKRQKSGGSVQRGQGLHDCGRSREAGRPFF